MIRDRAAAALFGIVLYPTVEPIDLGATYGVISMARRVLPGVLAGVRAGGRAATLAARGGMVALADAAWDVARAIEYDRAWAANRAALDGWRDLERRVAA